MHTNCRLVQQATHAEHPLVTLDCTKSYHNFFPICVAWRCLRGAAEQANPNTLKCAAGRGLGWVVIFGAKVIPSEGCRAALSQRAGKSRSVSGAGNGNGEVGLLPHPSPKIFAIMHKISHVDRCMCGRFSQTLKVDAKKMRKLHILEQNIWRRRTLILNGCVSVNIHTYMNSVCWGIRTHVCLCVWMT